MVMYPRRGRAPVPHYFLSLAAALALTGCGGGGGSSSGGGGSIGPGGPSGPVPTFSSGLAATTLEGSTGTVYTAQAAASGQTITYSLGGADAAKFNINASTGDLTFKTAPVYSSNVDNDVYTVTVTATTGGNQKASETVNIVVAQNIAARSYTYTSSNFDGGGYITGIVYHPGVQGLMYMRTDVGGSYRRDPGSDTWIPLNDMTAPGSGNSYGIFSLAVDPNNSNTLYEATGYYISWWAGAGQIMRSSDRGRTWKTFDLPTVNILQSDGSHQSGPVRLGSNEAGRGNTERLMVDPNDGQVLFLGTPLNGLLKSTDSGATWTQVSSFPTDSSVTFVQFDKASGTNGSATPVIYVGISSLDARQTYATSVPTVYRSTDGGKTWSTVANQPTGLVALTAKLDGQGHLYVVYGDNLGPSGISTGAVYRLTTGSGAWTDITPSGNKTHGYGGLDVSAQNPNVVMVSTLDWWGNDDIYRSSDGGATWTGMKGISTHTAPNNKWIKAYSGGSFGNMGGWITTVAIDPFDGNHVAYTGGWESSNALAGSVAWTYKLSNMQETCVAKIVSPSSGAAHVLETVGDDGGMRYTNDFSDDSGYFSDNNTTNFEIDVAEQNPNLVVRTSWDPNKAAYISNDNGVTWSLMPSTPVVKVGSNDKSNGSIVVSANGDSMLWTPGYQSAFYSTDGGKSWNASTGFPTEPTGFGGGGFIRPVSDRSVNGNGYYYAYNQNTGEIIASSDNGKTFTTLYSGLDTIANYVGTQGQLLSVPGPVRGNLWLTTNSGLYHFAGPGATKVRIANVQAAYGVAYGAPAPGKSNYTIYFSGEYNNVWGVFQSADDGATWTRVNDDQHQYGVPSVMAGDPRVFGRLYLGTGCRGLVVIDR